MGLLAETGEGKGRNEGNRIRKHFSSSEMKVRVGATHIQTYSSARTQKKRKLFPPRSRDDVVRAWSLFSRNKGERASWHDLAGAKLPPFPSHVIIILFGPTGSSREIIKTRVSRWRKCLTAEHVLPSSSLYFRRRWRAEEKNGGQECQIFPPNRVSLALRIFRPVISLLFLDRNQSTKEILGDLP